MRKLGGSNLREGGGSQDGAINLGGEGSNLPLGTCRLVSNDSISLRVGGRGERWRHLKIG